MVKIKMIWPGYRCVWLSSYIGFYMLYAMSSSVLSLCSFSKLTLSCVFVATRSVYVIGLPVIVLYLYYLYSYSSVISIL
jgi:hypothetical protein